MKKKKRVIEVFIECKVKTKHTKSNKQTNKLQSKRDRHEKANEQELRSSWRRRPLGTEDPAATSLAGALVG